MAMAICVYTHTLWEVTLPQQVGKKIMWKEVSRIPGTDGITHGYDCKEAETEHNRYGKVIKRIQKKK